MSPADDGEETEGGDLELEEIAALVRLSPPTVQKLLDRRAIPSHVTPSGHRRARRRDALLWRAGNERQRETLAELVAEAQAIEGTVARRPPSAIGDLNVEDDT